MAVLSSIIDSPSFATGGELSATLLNVIRDNALILDEASRLGRAAFGAQFGESPENNSTNPVRIHRGGFRFVTGATTLTIITESSGIVTGDQLRVIRDGTPTSGYSDGLISDFTLANGTQTHTITISGAGYADGRVVLTQCFLRNAGGPAEENDWGNVTIRDAYIGPIGLADAYPGVPTWGAISAANLNQLSNACDWLVRRVGQRVEPLWQGIVRRQGPFNDVDIGTQTTVRWRGGIPRSALHTALLANVAVQQKMTGTTEQVRLKINGSTVDTWTVPAVPGDYAHTLDADLSGYSAGASLFLEIDHIKTAPLGSPGDGSRFSLFRVWDEPPGGSPASIDELGMRSSYAFGPAGTPGTLQHWLASLGTILTAIKARIDANPEIWDRQPLFSARFSIEDDQFALFEAFGVAMNQRRTGEALVVRGKGITIGYGPGTFKEEFNDVAAQVFENFRTHTAIDADAVETQVVYFATIAGLEPGSPYNLRGVDIYYAAEQFLILGGTGA